MSRTVIRIDGEPVVLCFIAWMQEYNGVTADDTPFWDGRVAGYVVGMA